MSSLINDWLRGHKLARLVCSLLALAVLVPASAAALPIKSSAATVPRSFAISAATCASGNGFFGLEPWYKFFPSSNFKGGSSDQNKCDIVNFDPPTDVPLILLAVIDDLLRVAGIMAVGFVIYGGFQYTASQGNPDATSRAQGTIINALVGMAIAMVSVLIVSFIGHALSN
ncbi:MAG TPA: hypothetical protein VG604_03600 [Candidatus Saccharimonadales bacterium]|nr:hypothetical protein [Candidatus Saccharimonadales bacterium]